MSCEGELLLVVVACHVALEPRVAAARPASERVLEREFATSSLAGLGGDQRGKEDGDCGEKNDSGCC